MWPEVTYVSDIHPVVEWLVDRVLIRLGRQEAPVILSKVDKPVFLIQAVLCDALGRPTIVHWLAVTGPPDQPSVRPMDEVLAEAGVVPTMPNPGFAPPLREIQPLLPGALKAAEVWLDQQVSRDVVGDPLLRVLAVLNGTGTGGAR
jgi:hypothetical protein